MAGGCFLGNRQERDKDGLLGERVDELGIKDGDTINFAGEELLETELRDRLGLQEGRAVGKGEVGNHVPSRTGEERGTLLAGGHELGGGDIERSRLAEDIGIQSTAETLVGGDEENKALLHRTGLKKRVCRLADKVAERNEDAVQDLRVGMTRQRRLLRLAHLGGGDHLHRLGDLGGVLDRLDASADVAGIGHG